MKTFAIVIMILTSVVVGGSAFSSPNVAASPSAHGVNVRLNANAGKVEVPAGVTVKPIFGSWYTLPDMTVSEASSLFASTADVVEPNYIASAFDDPLVPQQYQLVLTHAIEAWSTSRGAGATIAIIDTGIDCTHEDLAAHCKVGKDFTGTGSTADDNGHGTHVAGIAAALGGNGKGGSGLAPEATLLPVKVLKASGAGEMDVVAQGMLWAAQNGAKVENLSLGCQYCPSQLMTDTVSQVRSLGTVVVAAAGNSNTSSPSSPAMYTPLGVGAIDVNSNRASFSNFGDQNAKVAAPGVGILSTCVGNQYCQKSGTSMASPVVAGAVALLASYCPSCSVSQIEDAVVRGADTINTDQPIGGRLNIPRSLSLLGAPAPNPTAVPTPGLTPTAATPGDFRSQLIAGINAQRTAAGLSPLAEASSLDAASDAHNQFMAQNDCFAHQCPGEPDPGTRAQNAGYPSPYIGENIAAGYMTPADVVTAWMNSSGHRANILGPYQDIGCGYLKTPNDSAVNAFAIDEMVSPTSYPTYWTCDFGNSGGRTLPATPTPRPQPTATSFVPQPSPTPWGAGYHMVVIADPGNKPLWDDLYYRYCSPPRPGIRCAWPRFGDSVTP